MLALAHSAAMLGIDGFRGNRTRATSLLRAASAKGGLSARVIDRVARTVADLAGAEQISAAHVAEAIGYRSLERRGVAA